MPLDSILCWPAELIYRKSGVGVLETMNKDSNTISLQLSVDLQMAVGARYNERGISQESVLVLRDPCWESLQITIQQLSAGIWVMFNAAFQTTQNS